MSKPWHSKEFLENEYGRKRKSIEVIAEECTKMGYSVTAMTIYNYLKRFDIPIRGGSRKLGKRSVGGNQAKRRRGGFY